MTRPGIEDQPALRDRRGGNDPASVSLLVLLRGFLSESSCNTELNDTLCDLADFNTPADLMVTTQGVRAAGA